MEGGTANFPLGGIGVQVFEVRALTPGGRVEVGAVDFPPLTLAKLIKEARRVADRFKIDLDGTNASVTAAGKE